MFVGNTNEEREPISIYIIFFLVEIPFIDKSRWKRKLSTKGTVSNYARNTFETVSKMYSNIFSIIGTYEITAFTNQKDNGIKIFLLNLMEDRIFTTNKVHFAIKFNSR